MGYYLIDRGAAELKARLGYRPFWRERAIDWALDHPQVVYFGSIAIAINLLVLLLTAAGLGGQLLSWWALLTAAALLLPVSELAVGLVNHLVTLALRPRVVPKLEFEDGIPADQATFIVIPSMLARPSSATVLLRAAEMHYLANTDPSVRIGLLTDFTDAPSETMPSDEELLRDALDAAARVE